MKSKHLDELLEDVKKVRDDLKVCPLSMEGLYGSYCGLPKCDLDCEYKNKIVFKHNKLIYN